MAPLRVTDTSNLVAAVPHLLGFHPQDSLVVLVVRDGRVITTMRVDLPTLHQRSQFADQVAWSVHNQHCAAEVVLVVYGGGAFNPEDAVDMLPHAGLIDELDYSLTCVRAKVLEAVWLESSSNGATWYAYCGCGCGRTGTLPDMEATELAAATAATGMVTYSSREELAAQVAPVAEDVLERRSALLDDALTRGAMLDERASLELVRAAVDEAAERVDPLSDDEVVQLALALSQVRVRDAALSLVHGDKAAAAERLFLELTRGCPAPERAEPATLLAFVAYLRGDGGLASLALTQAETACPGHTLTGLLRRSLDLGIQPAVLVDMVVRAESEARELLADRAHN